MLIKKELIEDDVDAAAAQTLAKLAHTLLLLVIGQSLADGRFRVFFSAR